MVPGLECQSRRPRRPTGCPAAVVCARRLLRRLGVGRILLPWFAQRGWHATAISLEGHGDSRGHAWLAALGIDDFARNVHAVVKTMPRPPVLIGH